MWREFSQWAFQPISENFHGEYLTALQSSQKPFPSTSAEGGSRPSLVAWAAASGEDGHMQVQGTPRRLWERRGELGPWLPSHRHPAPAHARWAAVPVASRNHQLNFLLWQSSVSFGPLTETYIGDYGVCKSCLHDLYNFVF